jgi:hypothetical protein
LFLVTIGYQFIFITKVINQLKTLFTKREKKQYNSLIFGILIIPTVQFFARFLIYKSQRGFNDILELIVEVGLLSIAALIIRHYGYI